MQQLLCIWDKLFLYVSADFKNHTKSHAVLWCCNVYISRKKKNFCQIDKKLYLCKKNNNKKE